jgi:hypothetical protein
MNKILKDIIEINSKFCRSINIIQDQGDDAILKGFICPNSFKLALRSIVDNVNLTGQSAFTWTGPYGSGKSSLALLLSSMLGKNEKLREISKNIIGKELAKIFYQNINVNNGWKILPIVGEQKKVENLLFNSLEKITKMKIDNFFDALTKLLKNAEGILIVIDEMGKCLEAAAKGIEDIYFYQLLAEFASRSKGKIIIIGILHQSFADYARYLPNTMKDEWIKVQGRYVDIPINTAGEEQVELIGKAIISTKHSDKFIDDVARITVDVIGRNRVIVSKENLIDRYKKCWPISPVVVSLLGQISRKKFGQNQRSIFSFLSSGEPKAFRDYINSTEYNENTLYLPTDLFEYIRINLESSILASTDSRLWHIALDSLSKCQAKGLGENHLNIYKTIAIIDLFSSTSGIVADIDLLKSLYPRNNELIENILDDLTKLSVIIFKKHRKAYSIYEGSDFDIEAALNESYSNINYFDISKLDEIANFRPVIAKRYYHQYGSMRWFDVLLTPVTGYKEFLEKEYSKRKAVGIFSILLPENTEEEKSAKKIVENINEFLFPVVFTIASNIKIINEYLKELIAIEWIQKNKNELTNDSIARREIEDRRQIVISALEVQLNMILLNSIWSYEGNKKYRRNNELSILASNICEEVYYQAPMIKSELVNRTKPSSSAIAALNILLHNMVINNGIKDLGMEGFSPESSLYNILLKDTGLYKKNRQDEFFFGETNRNNINHLWKTTKDILKSGKYITADEIYEVWEEKPLGIKEGLFTFFLLTFILTSVNDVAVYRDNVYVPIINDLFVDYLKMNSKSISLKLIKSDDISVNILTTVIHAVNKVEKVAKLENNSTPLLAAKSLVSIIDNLHPWVLKTKALSNTTIRFRELVKSANDPNKLIFDDIIKIFPLDNLYKGLSTALSELIEVYPTMIQSVGILITSELDIPLATPAYLGKLKKRAQNIKNVSGNFKVDAFAARISTFNSTYNDIAGIISLANNKPQKEWIDLDIENAKKEILFLCNEFKKAELYTKIKNRPASRQAIAFMYGIGAKTETISSEFDILIDKKDSVEKMVGQIKKLFDNEKDRNLVLTALAETSIDYLKRGKR